MKNRVSEKTENKKLKKQMDSNPMYFNCLNGKDVITEKISDHHPIVHDGVLFWNVMMQGKSRNGGGYNNGFGIIESDAQYIHRLKKIANVISEISGINSDISAICLCEGPIQRLHIDAFLSSLQESDSMNRFFDDVEAEGFFKKPNRDGFPNWGLMMFSDKKYQVNEVNFDFKNHSMIQKKLTNRFGIWALSNIYGENKYLALAHFPFGKDENITEREKLSADGNHYCQLITDIMDRYSTKSFVLCADFNFNPNLISQWNDRELDKIENNNSILLVTKEEKQVKQAVTVDGVLLSALEKQKYHGSYLKFGLFSSLIDEVGESHAKYNNKEFLIKNRHNHVNLQNKYDQQFGISLRVTE